MSVSSSLHSVSAWSVCCSPLAHNIGQFTGSRALGRLQRLHARTGPVGGTGARLLHELELSGRESRKLQLLLCVALGCRGSEEANDAVVALAVAVEVFCKGGKRAEVAAGGVK